MQFSADTGEVTVCLVEHVQADLDSTPVRCRGRRTPTRQRPQPPIFGAALVTSQLGVVALHGVAHRLLAVAPLLALPGRITGQSPQLRNVDVPIQHRFPHAGTVALQQDRPSYRLGWLRRSLSAAFACVSFDIASCGNSFPHVPSRGDRACVMPLPFGSGRIEPRRRIMKARPHGRVFPPADRIRATR